MSTRPSWWSRLARLWRTRHAGIGTSVISYDSMGFTVNVHDDGSAFQRRLLWQDVNGVVAYKRDLLYMDEICLAFSSPNGGVEVDEEMQGFDAFLDALPTYLAGLPSSETWWEKVALPPFATNVTKLYSR